MTILFASFGQIQPMTEQQARNLLGRAGLAGHIPAQEIRDFLVKIDGTFDTHQEHALLAAFNAYRAAELAEEARLQAILRQAVGDPSLEDQGTAQYEIGLWGSAIFEHYRDLILNAQQEVLLQTFQWHAGSEAANTLKQALIDLNQRLATSQSPNVTVYILYDGSSQNPLADIQQAGPLNSLQFLQIAYPNSLRSLLHSKSLIVDGRRALLTGANIQSYYDASRSWYDASFELGGGAALLLRQEFISAWRVGDPDKMPVPDGQFDPDDPSSMKYKLVPRPGAAVFASEASLNVQPDPDSKLFPVFSIGRPSGSSALAFTDAGLSDNSQARAYLALFQAAQRVIRIHTPNLNVNAVLEAIKAAAKRGVRVEIVLSKGFNEKTEIADGNNTWAANSLLQWAKDNGIGRNILDIRWYADAHAGVVDDLEDPDRKYASHAKYTSIDDTVVVVGSTNMDNQSFFHSREANMAVVSGAVTRAWDAQFFNPSHGRSKPITIDDRSALTKIAHLATGWSWLSDGGQHHRVLPAVPARNPARGGSPAKAGTVHKQHH